MCRCASLHYWVSIYGWGVGDTVWRSACPPVFFRSVLRSYTLHPRCLHCSCSCGHTAQPVSAASSPRRTRSPERTKIPPGPSKTEHQRPCPLSPETATPAETGESLRGRRSFAEEALCSLLRLINSIFGRQENTYKTCIATPSSANSASAFHCAWTGAYWKRPPMCASCFLSLIATKQQDD